MKNKEETGRGCVDVGRRQGGCRENSAPRFIYPGTPTLINPVYDLPKTTVPPIVRKEAPPLHPRKGPPKFIYPNNSPPPLPISLTPAPPIYRFSTTTTSIPQAPPIMHPPIYTPAPPILTPAPPIHHPAPPIYAPATTINAPPIIRQDAPAPPIFGYKLPPNIIPSSNEMHPGQTIRGRQGLIQNENLTIEDYKNICESIQQENNKLKNQISDSFTKRRKTENESIELKELMGRVRNLENHSYKQNEIILDLEKRLEERQNNMVKAEKEEKIRVEQLMSKKEIVDKRNIELVTDIQALQAKIIELMYIKDASYTETDISLLSEEILPFNLYTLDQYYSKKGQSSVSLYCKRDTNEYYVLKAIDFYKKLKSDKKTIERQLENVKREFINMMKASEGKEKNVAKPIYLIYNKRFALFLMEFGGENVDEYWNPGVKITLDYYEAFKQLAYGLSKIHSKLIHHGDIKPQNILFDNTNYKFTDFGSSKRFNSVREFEKTTMNFSGKVVEATLLYLPPEIQIPILQKKPTGENINFHKVDVYSLALTIYSMIIKRYPYDERELVQENMDRYPEFLQKVGKNIDQQTNIPKKEILKNTLLRCLSLDPHDRYTSEDISNMLQQVIYSNAQGMYPQLGKLVHKI